MVGKKTPPPGQQPRGSGAVPGAPTPSAELTEALADTNPQAAQTRTDPDMDQPQEVRELADQPGDAEEAQGKVAMGEVTFVGPEGRREITKGDWQRAGVADMPTVVWDRRANNHTVPKELFTREALLVLHQDQGFRIT